MVEVENGDRRDKARLTLRYEALPNPSRPASGYTSPMKTLNPPNTLGAAGLTIIKRFEGLELRAYLCPANKLTIGFGHVLGAPFDYKFFKAFDSHRLQACIDACQRRRHLTPEAVAGLFINPDQAETLLRNDSQRVAEFINSIHPELTPNQYDALVSLVFNIGQGNYAKSTLRAKLKAGDVAGAAGEFGRWAFATVNGVTAKLPGLVTRRAEERALFETPC